MDKRAQPSPGVFSNVHYPLEVRLTYVYADVPFYATFAVVNRKEWLLGLQAGVSFGYLLAGQTTETNLTCTQVRLGCLLKAGSRSGSCLN